MTLGNKIRVHRKMLGLTQSELGEKLGVKLNAVSKWECGRVEDIPTSKIKAMAKLFDVSISYLIDDEMEQPAGGGLSKLDEQIMEFLSVLTVEQKQMLLAQLRILTEGR